MNKAVASSKDLWENRLDCDSYSWSGYEQGIYGQQL